jgi:transposase
MIATELLSAAGPIRRLIADKAYDTNQLRNLLSQLDIHAVIPSIARRKPLIPYDRDAYRERNLIERMFARLKDFRRVATRYDKLASVPAGFSLSSVTAASSASISSNRGATVCSRRSPACVGETCAWCGSAAGPRGALRAREWCG